MKLNNLQALKIVILLTLMSCSETNKISEFDYTEEEKNEYVEKEQEDSPYFDDNAIRYEDHVYNENIKTDQMHLTGYPLSSPIARLTSGETLTLSFDDLGTDVEDYYYKIIHCDAKWNPTDLLENQYIEGFFSDVITDYDFSFNTLIQYVHYELQFPNRNMSAKISGNYIILVMRDNEEDQPVLSKRFMLVENSVAIVPKVRRAPSNADRNYKQLVEFEIQHASFPIVNPYRDLEVVVRQNERWDNALYDLKPIYIKDKRLIYESQNKYSFAGGNEYRFFNLRSIRYQTEQVQSIVQEEDGFHAWLTPYGKRRFSVYTTRFDINGRYEIKTTDAFDSKVEADYVKVHFTLPYDEPELDANLYVMGGFSDRQTHKGNQLFYNEQLNQYETEIILKQGYYDYQYVMLKDGDSQINATHIEGSHFATENGYDILVYFKDISDDYQRLIGARVFGSQDF
ncbi:MAG: hypothetical protein ACI8XB_002888 [Patiriisocius sp.]|jgi:hypothetical protein